MPNDTRYDMPINTRYDMPTNTRYYFVGNTSYRLLLLTNTTLDGHNLGWTKLKELATTIQE